MKTKLGFALVALLAAALSLSGTGCAAGAAAAGMTITPAELVKPTNQAALHAVGVAGVAGGTETNPAWTSQVSDAEFKAALIESLRLAGLLADGPARYTLKASLVSLQQPMFGLDMTVTASVHYEVTDARTGAVVWQEGVLTPHTATVGDAFVGVTRLKLANEGAVRKNIAKLVEQLGGSALPGPVGVN
jgi:hypothetical protein